jgi:hypothetical protein
MNQLKEGSVNKKLTISIHSCKGILGEKRLKGRL